MIYTKTGDNGMTSLFDNTRHKKSDLVFEVLGTIDELNSTLGFIHLYKHKEIVDLTKQLQSDLFFLGGLIAGANLTIEYLEKKTDDLEKKIDFYSEKLEPLTNFILPGGSIFCSYFMFSRAICRRLERLLVRYESNVYYIKFINRLSDLLFTLGRYSNKLDDINEHMWKPSTN